jgi:hypothetical protein
MTIIICDCPLNIEHCDHTSVEEFQSRQLPWVSFQILRCFASFYAREPSPPFLLFPRWRRWKKLMRLTRTSLNGSSWSFSWIQINQHQAPNTPNSLLSSRMDVPEDWIKWVMSSREIENLIPMKEPADKIRMFRTLLKGQALSYFEHHLMRRLEAEDSDVPDN